MQSKQRDLISRIISMSNKKYEKHIKALKKIDIKELENLDAADLQKYGITNSNDRKEIYQIIQQDIVENKRKRSIYQSHKSHQTLIRLICANNEFKKYRNELSNIDDSKLPELDKNDLTNFGIKNDNDRKEIFQIIQDIVQENKKTELTAFKKIKTYYLDKMRPLTSKRSKEDFRNECADEGCLYLPNKFSKKSKKCYPLRRIEIFLDVFNRVAIEKSVFNQIPMSEMILGSDLYGHQELSGDFQHLQFFHCNSQGRKDKLLAHMNKKYKCSLNECVPFKRHYREKNDENAMDQKLYYAQYNENKKYVSKSLNIVNEKDIVLQQKCDQIHAYFLHSDDCVSPMNNSDLNPNQFYFSKRGRFNVADLVESKEAEMSNSSKKKIKAIEYLGKKEDEKWFRTIETDTNEDKGKKQTDDEKKEAVEEMYKCLCNDMGTFQWQIAHGFKPMQNRNLQHLKPLFKDVKDEALNNIYEPLSKDNWNQTMRKSKVFYQSWARPRMRTKYDGKYDDQITGHHAEWKRGTEPSMEEIVTLKLYTDYDKLQFALKKCLRFHYDMWQNNCKFNKGVECDHDNADSKQIENEKIAEEEYQQAKNELEHRIRSFFHWRGKLMIVLNEFATKLSTMRDVPLYCGINTKMTVCASPTSAFYGPFSTSTSYHVARTFSTAKGMALKISSQFPRLDHCKAFDASMISDYPEENEYLIQFMYVRVEEITTKEMFDKEASYKSILEQYSIGSLMREEFFSVHLFREQFFCMKDSLGRNVAQYLRANRRECCEKSEFYKNKYLEDEENKYKRYRDGKCWDDILKSVCLHGAKHKNSDHFDETWFKLKGALNGNKQKKDDLIRMEKMRHLLWSKFDYCKNETESVTFDFISDILKRFFMEYGTEKDIKTNKYKWIISFDDIMEVYPNIKEIHFVNRYKFDNDILSKLIKKIKEKNNLKKVTFSYYDYVDIDESSKKPKYDIFMDPDKLRTDLKDKLKKLDWGITDSEVSNAGYKIIISQNLKKIKSNSKN